jgi:hypothetical protein
MPRAPQAAIYTATRIDERDDHGGPHHATWQNGIVWGLVRSRSVAGGWSELFQQSGVELVGADGSALLFCVRRHECPIAFSFSQGQNAEFEKERGIIYDNGGHPGSQIYLDSAIAHEILHLYGAVDLKPTKAPAPLNTMPDACWDNDVMHTPNHRPIDQYSIGEVTAYLVGWDQERPSVLVAPPGRNAMG